MNTVFSQWSQVDPNINQYGFGQLYNENGEPKVKQTYPGMWVNPTNTTVNDYALTRSYQVLIYDLVFIAADGESNQNKVISDCEEIAFRLVRFLKDKSDIFTINTSPTIVPFNDRFLDDVSGVILNVDIEFNAESSDCEDPDYSFNIKSNDI
jgi:hypothetical protein